MRMHGLIFAAIAGVPFVSISRVDKVDNFMSLFGLKPSGSIDKSDCSQLTADIERLLHNKDSFQKQITPRISALRQECLRNVELFNNLINRHKENWRKVSAFSLVYLLCSNKTFQRIQRLLHGEISFSQVLQKLFHTSKKVV